MTKSLGQIAYEAPQNRPMDKTPWPMLATDDREFWENVADAIRQRMVFIVEEMRDEEVQKQNCHGASALRNAMSKLRKFASK